MSAFLQSSTSHAAPPTVNDDSSRGFVVGSVWRDTSTAPDNLYLCADPTIGAAVWIGPLSSGGGGGGAVSTPIVIPPNQATPANITGFTRENDANLDAAGSTTDADGKLTLAGVGLPAVIYIDYGGTDTAPGYFRAVDCNGNYKMVFRMGMTNPTEVGDKGAVGGLYSGPGTPFASFWLSNNGGYRMRFVYNGNLIFSNALNDITDAVANAGVWCRLNVMNQRSVLAEMCFTNTTTEPTTGWIEVFSDYNLNDLFARPNQWVERFHVFCTAATVVGPVGTFEKARTSVVPF